MDLFCPKRSAELLSVGSNHNVMFYFICDFTCSRCWKGIMTLGRLHSSLQERDTDVVVVGEGRYLEPAAQLAADFELPFCFTSDEDGTLRGQVGFRRAAADLHSDKVVLIDGQGAVAFRQRGLFHDRSFDESTLMAAIDHNDYPSA